ncbi:MAG TPA: HAMP domain-containing sensor histidine kinase [Acidimicrobiia bacterium]|nr:HAMP domain-containing sensor histidine kinase [Acidimicrobiia bacterium]
MRRRLFWTIAGVAAAMGGLVLIAAVYASQRAAVDATFREMKVSSDEAVAIIHDYVAQSRPLGAVVELVNLLEGDQVAPLFSRIRRTAGGSEIGFAWVDSGGNVHTNAPIFNRLDIVGETFNEGVTRRTRSTRGELVVVTPTTVTVRGAEVTFLVALARQAPIVRLRDQGPGLILVVASIVVFTTIGARVLSDQLANRLQPLAEASRKVAGGDLKARVPDIGDPELDAVGDAFNEMATELEAARERERDFILGVGHDLRTPLTTIGGYAEVLESGDISEDDLARIGSVLTVQSRQLGRLIDDLSTLARLEGAEFSLRNETVDVGAHVTEVVEGFRRRADELGVRLEVTAGESVVMETDPDRLGQIAQNLVENALRHTPETGSVSVDVTGDDGAATIVVSDSGIGIPSEDLPHVFDRHFVVRQRSVHKEGTGLGLSIVKGLVDRMGGTVTAESKPGQGTTITVRLTR